MVEAGVGEDRVSEGRLVLLAGHMSQMKEAKAHPPPGSGGPSEDV